MRLATRSASIFEPLDDRPRDMCPIDDERLIESAAAGMLPLVIEDELSSGGRAARRRGAPDHAV